MAGEIKGCIPFFVSIQHVNDRSVALLINGPVRDMACLKRETLGPF